MTSSRLMTDCVAGALMCRAAHRVLVHVCALTGSRGIVLDWHQRSQTLMTSHDVCALTGSRGMVLDWHQRSQTLMTSGDVKYIRLWDVNRESKIQVSAQRGNSASSSF